LRLLVLAIAALLSLLVILFATLPLLLLILRLRIALLLLLVFPLLRAVLIAISHVSTPHVGEFLVLLRPSPNLKK
jgi:hypothetical protein